MQGHSVKNLIESLGAEGFYHKICTLLNEQKLSVEDLSYYEVVPEKKFWCVIAGLVLFFRVARIARKRSLRDRNLAI